MKRTGYLQDISFVNFYGKPIVTAYSDEIGYVTPLKFLVEDHLGLDWTEQRKKLNSETSMVDEFGTEYTQSLYAPVMVSGYDLKEGLSLDDEYPEDLIPKFSPNAEYLCLPINQLPNYLAQINVNRVSIEIRENLFLYQRECAGALHEYWFRGMAINTRTNPSRISSDRHDWCPREMSTKSLSKSAARYSVFAERTFDSRLNPEDIENYAKEAIANILQLESSVWDDQEGSVAYLISFMERAAFDILFFAIEANLPPEDLEEKLELNLMNAWENIGTLVLAVQSPYNPFPGVGRGARRELI